MIGAVAGSAIAVGLTVGCSSTAGSPRPPRTLAAVAALAAVLYACLTAIALEADWTRAEPDEWTAYAA